MRSLRWALISIALLSIGLTRSVELPAPPLAAAPASECVDLDGDRMCVHADQPPPGIELGLPLDSYPQYHEPPAALGPAATDGIECYGDGATGPRVQAVYAHSASAENRADTVVPQIAGTYAPRVETEFNESAKQTGGERHVRWVTDPDCNLRVEVIALPDAILARLDWSGFLRAMSTAGLNRTDRIYLVWADASAVCGVGGMFPQDNPSRFSNRNAVGPNWSRVDTPCWGYADSHELMHNLGGVQASAPHATAYGHCTDEWDRMCYADGPGSVMNFDNAAPGGRCIGRAPRTPGDLDVGNERRFDCNGDDYYSTNPAPGSYLATRWNTANNPFLSSFKSGGPLTTGAYRALATPHRVLDTRLTGGPIPAGGRLAVRVTGSLPPLPTDPPVPGAGVAAIVLNVTVTAPREPGFLSVRPLRPGQGLPEVSNLNYAGGQTVANLVTVPVGAPPAAGFIELYASRGLPNVLVDVIGWHSDGAGLFPERGGFHALTPSRIMDTRIGLGVAKILGPNETVALKVTGTGGVPADGVSSVVLNVTATDATASSYLTVWAAGEGQPNASNLNFVPGGAVPNLVVARVGRDGAIQIFNESGQVNVIADVAGWFDTGAAEITGGATFRALGPERVVDTRQSGPIGPRETRSFAIANTRGIPANAKAIVANVTVDAPTTGGYLTVFPSGQARPNASTVNFSARQTVPNLAYATLGAGGVDVYNDGEQAHVLIDVSGYFA